MKLNDKQNLTFMTDSRRIEAEAEVRKTVENIRASLQFPGSAQYYLTVLPPRLQALDRAMEMLSIVEATVEAEVLGKERYHG